MNGTDRLLALTFDDGPNDIYTPKLLEVLSKHNATATFFLIGKHVQRHPEITRSIHSAGHAIGNHTFNHPMLVGLSQADIRKELEDCQRVIEDTVGHRAGMLFRPPFGKIDENGMYASGYMSLVAVNWSVEAEDWLPKPAQKMADIIGASIDRRSQDEIILLHDGSPEYPPADRKESVQTAKLLLERYATSGHKFLTLPEMIQSSGRAIQLDKSGGR